MTEIPEETPKENPNFPEKTKKAMKTIAITLNLLLSLVILYFVRGLSWEKEKASIIGFWTMIFVYILNISLLWVSL